MIYKFSGSIEVTQEKACDLRPHLRRAIVSTLASEFAHQQQNEYLIIKMKDFKIDLGFIKLEFTSLDKSEEYRTYHVVEHLLLRIFLGRHPGRFGFNKPSERQRIVRGLDTCMIVSSGDNKPFFETTKKLFRLFNQNQSVFSKEEKAEIKMCKRLMAKIKDRKGKPFKSYELKEEV